MYSRFDVPSIFVQSGNGTSFIFRFRLRRQHLEPESPDDVEVLAVQLSDLSSCPIVQFEAVGDVAAVQPERRCKCKI